MSEIEGVYNRLKKSKRVTPSADVELAALGGVNIDGFTIKMYKFQRIYQLNILIPGELWDSEIGSAEMLIFAKRKAKALPKCYLELKPFTKGFFGGTNYTNYFLEFHENFLNEEKVIINLHGITGEESNFINLDDFIGLATREDTQHLEGFDWDLEIGPLGPGIDKA